MAKFNSLFRFNVNNLMLFSQKSWNGKVCLLKKQPFVFTKGPVRCQNTIISPVRKANQKDPYTIGGMILLGIPVAAFALGTWQVKRLKWKEDLIEKLKAKTSAPPIEFPIDLAELENLEYRRVVVRGKFDHSKEIFLGPKPCLINGQEASSDMISKTGQGSYGYLVITPFILSESGQRILINRGWILTKNLSRAKRPESLVQGEMTIVGVVRHTEPKGSFTPKSNPDLNIWYCRDIDDMAAHTGTLPVFLDATEESSIPGVIKAGQTRIHLRNEHMSYIFTWYSLSLATAFMWYRYFIHR